jgi:choline dehydrogenase-like flavoprotein
MTVPDEVDIIVVGGGSCGCVVAGRLANLDHNLQVMLIEAGESNLNVCLTEANRSRPMTDVLAEPLGIPSWHLPQEHEARQ